MEDGKWVAQLLLRLGVAYTGIRKAVTDQDFAVGGGFSELYKLTEMP